MVSTFAEPSNDATLKFFAYFGGPFVLDFIVSRFRRGRMAQSPDEVASYFGERFKDQIYHQSAAAVTTFETNCDNVTALFGVHCRIMEIAKSNDSQESQQSAIHRAVGGMLKEIVFSTGDAGAKRVEGTPIEPFDNLRLSCEMASYCSWRPGCGPAQSRASRS
jgi:hypothetical protein